MKLWCALCGVHSINMNGLVTCKRLVMIYTNACDFCKNERKEETDQVRVPDHPHYGWQVCSRKQCKLLSDFMYSETVLDPKSLELIVDTPFTILRSDSTKECDWQLGWALRYDPDEDYTVCVYNKDKSIRKNIPLNILIKWQI